MPEVILITEDAALPPDYPPQTREVVSDDHRYRVATEYGEPVPEGA